MPDLSGAWIGAQLTQEEPGPRDKDNARQDADRAARRRPSSTPFSASREDRIDQAFAEFCSCLEAGNAPEVNDFCARFPHLKRALKKLIEAYVCLVGNPQLLYDSDSIPWPKVGETFAGFVLNRELGRGAFARVFLASEPALGNRQVAVKISPHGSAEAQTLGRLEHPHIVAVHSVQRDRTTGLTVVCMPYLGSATLYDVLDRAFAGASLPGPAQVLLEAVKDAAPAGEWRPGPEDVHAPWNQGTYVDGTVQIATQLADALAFIHGRGICHRDLKPSNVLLNSSGRAMLLDFNLSFDRGLEAQRLGGTLPYMSPEQLLATDAGGGAAPGLIDQSSDLFSLGIILYELLAGEHPFGPVSSRQDTREVRALLLDRHREGPRPVREVNPHVDKHLAGIVESCLAYNPIERPASAGKLAAMLRNRQSRWRRARRWIGRHALLAAAVAIAFCAVAGAAAYGISQRDPYGVRMLKEGQAAYQRGEYIKAVDDLTRALGADTTLQKRPDIRFALGRANQQLADRTRAAQVACTDPQQKSLLDSESLQQYTSAWIVYDHALKLAPETGPTGLKGKIYACLGYCYSRNRHWNEAALAHEQAMAAGFATAEVYNNLGYTYLSNGQVQEARECFAKSIRLDPNLQAPYHNRALMAIDQMLMERSKDELAMRTLSPPDILRSLLTATPNSRPGIMDIEKSIELGPATAEIYRDAAFLYFLHGTRKSNQLDHALRRLEGSPRTLRGGVKGQSAGSRPAHNPIYAALTALFRQWLLCAAQDARSMYVARESLAKAIEHGFPSSRITADRFLSHLRTARKDRFVPGVQTNNLGLQVETRLIDPVRDELK